MGRILTVAIAILFVVAVGVFVFCGLKGGQLSEAQEQLNEAQSQLQNAKDTNASLQEEYNTDMLEYRNAQGRLTFLGDGSGKVAYLTFDDGPSALTKKNLKILKKYDITATWFCLANTKEFDYLDLSLCKKIEKQGSVVGIHDWDQNDSYEYYKNGVDWYFENDFNKTKEALEEQVGHEIKIMRFAGGSPTIGYYNSKIAKDLPIEMLKRGYQFFDWNVLAYDSDPTYMVDGIVPADTIVEQVLGQAKAFANSNSPICILMHDNPGKDTTTAALPRIIEGLQELGYTFDTLKYETGGFYQTKIVE